MPEDHYLRKELYALLREDPKIFDFFRESSFDGVWFWDLENPEHEWISPEFWRLFGYDPKEKQHLASEWQDMIFPEDRDLALANFEAHIADPDHRYDQIVRYRHKDGQTVYVRCRGLALRNESGDATRLFGTHVDVTAITEMRQKEIASITVANTMLGEVLNTATSGIVGLDEEGTIITINPSARHMLGALNEAEPMAWPEAIQFLEAENHQPLDASASPLNRALAGQRINQEIHLMNRWNASENRYVRMSSATIEGGQSPVKTVLVLDDVSEQEKNRQQIERRSRLDALGQLTGGIAHDFNNLLATVRYATELLDGETLSGKGREHLRTIQGTVERGADLTSRLLAFAKRQFGVIKTHPAQQILESFRKLVRPTIEGSIDLNVICKDPELQVHCDHPQLENALLNLVLNSRDAILRSASGGRITISARGISSLEQDETLERERTDSHIAPYNWSEEEKKSGMDGKSYRYVEFSVSDDGPGMSAEVKRRAVDPFFTTKRANSGTGLGLSMVYGFAQQGGGILRIYSEEGQGTTVRLILPRGDAGDLREAPQVLPSAPAGSGERVLVAEDDKMLQSVIRDVIISFGYEVVAVSSGTRARELLDRGDRFDLLLTDIVMPGGIGGFELARLARERHPDLPIIYMSGYAGLREEDMGAVIAPMVRKPCQPDELAKAISKAIGVRGARA